MSAWGRRAIAAATAGLWQNVFPIMFLDNLGMMIQLNAPKLMKDRSGGKATEL
jgi:hypothetical protein